MSAVCAQRRVLPRRERLRRGSLLALLHALPAAALLAGTQPLDWLVLAFVYPVQAVGVGVGLHRYFAHRSFRTHRWFQFALALASAATFGNAVGFAGKHRLHHRYSDTPQDVHTPRHGLWACWLGSLLDHGHSEAAVLARVPDLTRYPELMWLHRHPMVPGLALCALAFVLGGWTTLAIGVCLGAVICIHQSSAVNYLCHAVGRRPFRTRDRSTNQWLVALLTFGEGWHNNHHRFPASARAGLRWYELDLFYWLIVLWERLGLVWAVRRPPPEAFTEVRDPCPSATTGPSPS